MIQDIARQPLGFFEIGQSLDQGVTDQLFLCQMLQEVTDGNEITVDGGGLERLAVPGFTCGEGAVMVLQGFLVQTIDSADVMMFCQP